MDSKKRVFLYILAFGLLAITIGLGFIVVPDIIQEIKPSNVRFDETSTNHFYSQFLYDINTENDDLLVINSAEKQMTVRITCYEVMNPELVLPAIKANNIAYDAFTYSVYGILAPIPPEGSSPSYRFLFQESMMSTARWYISRVVLPSFDYVDNNGHKIHVTNEGITTNEILGGIDDFLDIPFT